jgi:hypothetical protein
MRMTNTAIRSGVALRPSWLATLGLSLIVASPTALTAQVTASERSTLTQSISGTEIVIDYARPSARGRPVLFGGLVPWGVVWTPGANDATTFRFSKDVSLNDQDVPAGKYSIWMQPREAEPWVLMLHTDTTLFHIPHPSLDEAFMTIQVKPEQFGDFTETLTFDIEAVRADGAEIQLRWGETKVPIRLGVDPGYVLTVKEAEAARYVGEWSVDHSMSAPPAEALDRIRQNASPEELEQIDSWLASIEEPAPLTLVYDTEERRLYAYDPVMAEMMGDTSDGPQHVLIRKGEGIFSPGALMNGELAFVFDESFWEFEFDAAGVAVTLVQRGGDDRVQGRGTRAGG